ncbi:1-acyl-sn-glycerol-3-phosphate acyltransferase [Caballeronia sp. LZ001]|uniref:lysophospholipid acyltransferase family protein n=1 Tax=Caballeronia sp. LZ001 TaxID=3038553 RepID=UPI00286335E7|nr:1-acyl-sn-glycerol-3-phosphate acyltransferase [Caballeronia sp. LZ001]MDR5801390.1 1-acyl-sn-glycerol-3-phosphate acyltransferase [Caballeronia sp. LZ001]
MRARVSFAWRWIATGLIFLSFGMCGAAFSLLLFPLTLAWPHRTSAQFVSTRIVHLYFRALTALLQAIGVMRLEVDANVRNIKRGAIIVANHPTYLDVMILLALIPSACCVVKHAHWRNPCFFGIVRATRYVSNRDHATLIEESVQRLCEGYSMIVFPEGTRSPANGGLHPFSRGFAHMMLAMHAHADAPSTSIVPVVLTCDPPVFTKERRWYHVPRRPFCFRVSLTGALDARQWSAPDAAPAVAARVLASGIQNHISQHLLKHEFPQAGN